MEVTAPPSARGAARARLGTERAEMRGRTGVADEGRRYTIRAKTRGRVPGLEAIPTALFLSDAFSPKTLSQSWWP